LIALSIARFSICEIDQVEDSNGGRRFGPSPDPERPLLLPL
jgi:hypothetical protein